jgi:hypothetical protein
LYLSAKFLPFIVAVSCVQQLASTAALLPQQVALPVNLA